MKALAIRKEWLKKGCRGKRKYFLKLEKIDISKAQGR